MRGVEPVIARTLFATFFEQPQNTLDDCPLSHRGDVVTFRDKDPFHTATPNWHQPHAYLGRPMSENGTILAGSVWFALI